MNIVGNLTDMWDQELDLRKFISRSFSFCLFTLIVGSTCRLFAKDTERFVDFNKFFMKRFIS